MQTMISKWGNSLALRLPRLVAEQARLVEGTTVDLEVDDGILKVIHPQEAQAVRASRE